MAPDVSNRIVDMIDLLASDVSSREIDRVFLLASEGTIASGIYQDRFGKHGVAVDSADDAMQSELRGYIEAVKQNKVSDLVKVDFAKFLQNLGEQNVVLGCTELPILVEDVKIDGVNLLDPMQSAIEYAERSFEHSRMATA